MLPDLNFLVQRAQSVPYGQRHGTLTRLVGLLVECRGLRSGLGETCRLENGSLELEVVGFRDDATLLMPLGESGGLRPGTRVVASGETLGVRCSPELLGRVLDGLGRPLDGGGPLRRGDRCSVVGSAMAPLDREPIRDPLTTGVSVLDGFLTLGRGQRLGIFAGSGVGKSSLLADVARHTEADVNVIALVGERGREVRHFIEEALGPEGLKKSVIVVATSDAPPLLRIKASYTAVTIAEYFRDQGRDVMLMMDSVTRFAAAMREVGLALGEPPTVRGYPPSFFGAVPRLVERLGRSATGSISGIFTVLVDGDDFNEPVTDTLRGLLDGHVILSRKLAQRGRFPAVDVLASTSRIMDQVTTKEHQQMAQRLRGALAAYEENRDLIMIGAYKPGSDPRVDQALQIRGDLEDLLAQGRGAARPLTDTLARMGKLAAKITL